MERQKRWQLLLIVAVLLITVYNILPTLFFYSKPLRSPIHQEQAFAVAQSIVDRIDVMEEKSIQWLESFSKLLHVKPLKIKLRPSDPHLIDITFANSEEATRFKSFLPRAGAMIPFVPAQLQLGDTVTEEFHTVVTVERKLGFQFDQEDVSKLFFFSDRFDKEGQPTKLYRELVNDRLYYLIKATSKGDNQAEQIESILSTETSKSENESILNLSEKIVELDKALSVSHQPLLFRILSSYSKDNPPQEKFSKILVARFNAAADQILSQKQALGEDLNSLEPEAKGRIAIYDRQLKTLSAASKILEKHSSAFDRSFSSIDLTQVRKKLEREEGYDATSRRQTIYTEGQNPLIQSLTVDWLSSKVEFQFYGDVQEIIASIPSSEEQAYVKSSVEQLVINEIARISQETGESLISEDEKFALTLSSLTNSKSFLALRLDSLASREVDQLQQLLLQSWQPYSRDLTSEFYPVRNFEKYQIEPAQDQRLGIVIYAPTISRAEPFEGFESDSIYVIARGLQDIVQKYRETPSEELNKTLSADFNSLTKLLEQRGFIHYSGQSSGIAKEFARDYIFCLPNFYGDLIKATRENFTVNASRNFAVLDFTDVEQRILTLNRIEDKEHEDLLKWRDDYQAAQVDLNSANKYYVPKPTQNVYWDNFRLSTRKYFRGDESKILKWGLDLSGGKTVRIGLVDQNGRPVTDSDDLKQAVNELYTRINKMGVAERSIRLEGSNVILDFPGSQGLSASELIKASSMFFHIINEKFSPSRGISSAAENREVLQAANQFLQSVWNEAVITNRKDAESINAIAWKHLGGDKEEIYPRSENAKILWENGLKLADPTKKTMSGALNESLSSIAIYKGENYSEWGGNTHPLVFVFHNYALEGSNLTNIQVGYDPSEGNMLSFEVKNRYEGNKTGSPSDDFHAWTLQFSKEQIAGTPKELYSNGEGWRMAVILNDRIISAPTLQAALKDRARITGRFSQREVNQLAADLKAGSLSFTPKILAEENISPDLGLEERYKGIRASLVAIIAVLLAMVGYYRFAGVVASVAVLINLLIMWGVLQSIGAALTLSGIAGLVLTIGMAVDANVLVFERFREEFRKSGRVASAMQAGYRKAFSAIVDSNITTILAALILIQFDSGPVKGFATIIIIGVVSSMFTGLFMTRFFFAGWIEKHKHTELKMAQWIHDTTIDFLGYARPSVAVAVVLSILSIFSLWTQKNSMLGMDFTGGYALTVELQENSPQKQNYRLLAKNALEKQGILSKDVQVKQLSRPTQLKIQIGMGAEEPGRPFYNISKRDPAKKSAFAYQEDPRIDWVVKALSEEGLFIRQADLEHLENHWTIMSGQFSEAMRNNALWALGLALAAILLYITLRFEFKYAIAAVAGLFIDVFLSLGILSLFHFLGFSVQIDLEIVGAVMMIVGYSLNDTIIVFDRIREDVKVLRKMKFSAIVNHALNVTLSRTLMTSGTTLLVLLSLVMLGGNALFGFSLTMAIGVIVGTLGSLFVCAPIMLFFHEHDSKKEEERRALQKM